MRILVGIVSVYLIWLLVKAMKMELIATILGQIMGVGMIALIIVFQQEVRRFLLILGNRYFQNNKLNNFFQTGLNFGANSENLEKIVSACLDLSKEKTGALIVLSKTASLKSFSIQGEILNAEISSALLKTIFYKDNPLHDGAVLIEHNKIVAAKCILPVSDNTKIPKRYGLRHRSALGMSENSDTVVIVVSEQTGEIAIMNAGNITTVKEKLQLKNIIDSMLNV